MKKQILLLASVICLAFTACEDPQADPNPPQNTAKEAGTRVLNLRAHLSGDQEVPAVDTRATGQAIFKLSKDGTELHYKLIVANIENVMMAHIHVAAPGSNGGVVTWLYPDGPPPVMIPGRFSGVLAEGVITAADLRGALAGMQLEDLLALMYEGMTYVNVHTQQAPGGEIRGQIMGNQPGNL